MTLHWISGKEKLLLTVFTDFHCTKPNLASHHCKQCT